MPDIAMCLGFDCPSKDKCYRYTAIPNPYRQTYFVNSPISLSEFEDKDKCEYFYPNTVTIKASARNADE